MTEQMKVLTNHSSAESSVDAVIQQMMMMQLQLQMQKQNMMMLQLMDDCKHLKLQSPPECSHRGVKLSAADAAQFVEWHKERERKSAETAAEPENGGV